MAGGYDHNAGERFGDWILIRPLGHGGNGEVWLAHNQQHSEGAIKIGRGLGNPARERYRRFVNEVRFYEGLGERPGILPVLGTYLPERPTRGRADPPWLVM